MTFNFSWLIDFNGMITWTTILTLKVLIINLAPNTKYYYFCVYSNKYYYLQKKKISSKPVEVIPSNPSCDNLKIYFYILKNYLCVFKHLI